jgi:hypothetical protein
MEFELEDRPQQMGEDDALDIAENPRSPQRDRTRAERPSQTPAKQDQAVFIPEQEPGSG